MPTNLIHKIIFALIISYMLDMIISSSFNLARNLLLPQLKLVWSQIRKLVDSSSILKADRDLPITILQKEFRSSILWWNIKLKLRCLLWTKQHENSFCCWVSEVVNLGSNNENWGWDSEDDIALHCLMRSKICTNILHIFLIYSRTSKVLFCFQPPFSAQ